jgi:hypothetical protein
MAPYFQQELNLSAADLLQVVEPAMRKQTHLRMQKMSQEWLTGAREAQATTLYQREGAQAATPNRANKRKDVKLNMLGVASRKNRLTARNLAVGEPSEDCVRTTKKSYGRKGK